MRRRKLLAALAAVVALGAAACGDGGDDQASTAAGQPTATAPATNPVATAPEATTPPPDATEPGARTIAPPPETAPAEPPPANTAPAEPEPTSEAEPVRVRAEFTIRAGALDPPAVTVPPFLAVALSVTADDGAAHEIVVRAPRPAQLSVPAGESASARLPGMRAGRYAIEVDGREAGALDVGGEVGP